MAEVPSAELIERSSLLASDFDNTVALTSEPLPGGKTVEEAYEIAIAQTLGPIAIQTYLDKGGLRNRAPVEIVAELTPNLPEWLRKVRTEEVVEKKLDILLPQFGQRLPDGRLWPPAVEGMPEVWEQLHAAKEVSTAIISSGHDQAISRFFDIHELPQPDVTVTDDNMRPIAGVLPGELCAKPSSLLIEWAHYRWLDRLGLISLASDDPEAYWQARQRITYVGDDPEKDGRLARNAGVDFVHIPRDNPAPAWQYVGRLLVPQAFNEAAHA